MNHNFTFDEVTSHFYNEPIINHLKHYTIGIAGAGGLGSNCALMLVRSGIYRFVIADFDLVSVSNLNRQAYSAEHIGKLKVYCLRGLCTGINPDVHIETYPQRIDASNVDSLFNTCDVIIEAFDNPASKALLFSHFLHSTKLLVGASGIAGIGNSEKIKIRKVGENSVIVGDETSGVSETLKPYAPRVMVAAAMMADVVLDWLVEEGDERREMKDER